MAVDNNEPKCEICGERLAGETWTDDDEYGDVHVRCLEERDQ